tara:strand:- start:17 stop:763 length:747 start_codon:yes stop_codon:yes gene_type:complete
MSLNLRELINQIPTGWKPILLEIVGQYPELISKIETTINEEKEAFDELLEIFPPDNNIFASFSLFEPEETKVILLGQDPYHGKGQAMGLSFSVPEGINPPPSLRNIYKEVSTDIEGFTTPEHGNLTYWGQQGVLLLNTALTVRQGSAGSHAKLWKDFTDQIIIRVASFSQPMVYFLWGGHAKRKKELILKSSSNNKKSNPKQEANLILESNHPSPLSANRGGWYGCKHFSQCNQYLQQNNIVPIDWQN